MGFLLLEGLVKKWPEGSQEPLRSQLNAVQLENGKRNEQTELHLRVKIDAADSSCTLTSTGSHAVATHMTVIFVFITVRTWDLAHSRS